jgi:hypothetical protein
MIANAVHNIAEIETSLWEAAQRTTDALTTNYLKSCCAALTAKPFAMPRAMFLRQPRRSKVSSPASASRVLLACRFVQFGNGQ